MFYLVIKLTKLLALPKARAVSVSYFFRADDYTVVMGALGMKYGTKNAKESNRDCKPYGTIDLSFKIAIG